MPIRKTPPKTTGSPRLSGPREISGPGQAESASKGGQSADAQEVRPLDAQEVQNLKDSQASENKEKTSPMAARMESMLGRSALKETGEDAENVAVGVMSSAGFTYLPSEVSPAAPNDDAALGVHGSGMGGGGSRSLDVSDGIVTGSLAGGNAERSWSASSSLMPGWAGLTGSMEWASPNGSAHRAGGTIFGWNDYLGLSVEFADKGPSGKTRGVSLAGWVTADRRVTDLGDGKKSGGPNGSRRLELAHKSGAGGAIGSGLAAAVLGFGAKVTLNKNKEIVYRTALPPDQASEILFEKKGFAGFIKDKARALGASEDKLSIPPLTHPEDLKVGDELVVSTEGSVQLGVAVGGFGARVGVAGKIRGDFDLAARKLDEHRVELAITPTQIKAIHGFADLPFIFDLRKGSSWAKAFRQSFVFDLRIPEARKAYEEALKGDFPEGLSTLPNDDGAALGLAEVVKREVMPVGVARTHLERVQVSRDGYHVGLTWGPIHDLWGVAGLGAGKTTTKSRKEVTDGQSVLVSEDRGVSRKRDVLISGSESTGVLARLRQHTTLSDDGEAVTEFLGLSLKGILTDDRVRGFELNNEVIDKINHTFGLSLPHFTVKGDKKDRQVAVSQDLNARDLQALSQTPAENLRAVAKRLRVREARLFQMQEKLNQTQDPSERARAVQDFVAATGFAGLGAVHELLDKTPQDLAVSTHAHAYEGPLAQADTLAFKYRERIGPQETNKALSNRFAEVDKAMEKLEASLALVLDDPLVDEKQRTRVSTTIRGHLDTLKALNQVDHLSPPQRLFLFEQLDKGWTTGKEARVMRALESEGLPD
jgi:hypothetical protein